MGCPPQPTPPERPRARHCRRPGGMGGMGGMPTRARVDPATPWHTPSTWPARPSWPALAGVKTTCRGSPPGLPGLCGVDLAVVLDLDCKARRALSPGLSSVVKAWGAGAPPMSDLSHTRLKKPVLVARRGRAATARTGQGAVQQPDADRPAALEWRDIMRLCLSAGPPAGAAGPLQRCNAATAPPSGPAPCSRAVLPPWPSCPPWPVPRPAPCSRPEPAPCSVRPPAWPLCAPRFPVAHFALRQ